MTVGHREARERENREEREERDIYRVATTASDRSTSGLETRKTPGRMAASAWNTSSATLRGSRNCRVGDAARAVTSTPPPYDANSIMNP